MIFLPNYNLLIELQFLVNQLMVTYAKGHLTEIGQLPHLLVFQKVTVLRIITNSKVIATSFSDLAVMQPSIKIGLTLNVRAKTWVRTISEVVDTIWQAFIVTMSKHS